MPLFVSILSIFFIISSAYIFITIKRHRKNTQIHVFIKLSALATLIMLIGLTLIKLTDVLDMNISRDHEFLMYSVEIVLYLGVIIPALFLFFSSKRRNHNSN